MDTGPTLAGSRLEKKRVSLAADGRRSAAEEEAVGLDLSFLGSTPAPHPSLKSPNTTCWCCCRCCSCCCQRLFRRRGPETKIGGHTATTTTTAISISLTFLCLTVNFFPAAPPFSVEFSSFSPRSNQVTRWPCIFAISNPVSDPVPMPIRPPKSQDTVT